ncbi:MAG: DUF1236 domain-containing protein [Mesorhizobium sp.]|nr:MAG: DUF1236 domain-containing protein [Mesorhizobium sp.]
MKHLLITSMIALGVGCGAAMAQTESVQPSGDANCASGQADCKTGGKAGGQAQGETKSKPEMNAQGKAKMKTDEQAQGQAGAKTDQNAQDNTQLKKKQQAQGKAGATTEQNAQGGNTKMQTEQNAQTQTGTKTEQNAQGNTNVETDQNKTASINNVTVEQRTQVTQIIHETKVEPVRDISFDISVGIEVPRHKVRLHRLPARIVKIVPAYESYEYFVLADGRIVIVDPDTYKIVLILT